jgi:hypothetical protein
VGFLETTDCQVLFLIQFANQYLLVEELNPLIFTVNIERYVVIPDI